jgi:hypothetical protein
MGTDWIDSLLQKAEGIPVLGGIAHDLRIAYDVWSKEPANPQPVRNQAQNLDDLYNTAAQLRSQFNDSLLTLRQKWTGDAASAYLGPEITAFQVEHDMEPAFQGAGYNMWNHLNLITSLLDYNGTAHHKAADKLDKIQSLHGELNTQFLVAVGALGTAVATEEIPVVDIFTDVVGGGTAAVEAGDALATAEEIETTVQAVETVEEVAQTTRTASTLMKVVSVVVVTAMIADIALLPFAVSSNVDNPNGDQSGITYPPGIETDQQKLIYRTLFFEYGDSLLAAYLAKSGLSLEECEALIQQFGLATVKKIANEPRCGGPNTFDDMFKARNIPGIEQVVQDLANAGSNGQGYSGAIYELWWMANNANNIAQVQLPATGVDGKPKKGPDAQLDDGTIVQLKNYQWDKPFLNDVAFPREIRDQVAVTQRNYPGQPIKFVFNGCNGPLPQAVLDTLNELASKNVSWEYWPPLNSSLCPGGCS